MWTKPTTILLAMTALGLGAGCTGRIETAQLRILDTDSQATFEGNDLVTGDRADASQGLTIVEGLATIVEIRVGDGDPRDSAYEGEGETFARAGEGLIVYPIADDDEQRRFMVAATRDGGDLRASSELIVSSSSYDGELHVPVRFVRQDSYDHVTVPFPWP